MVARAQSSADCEAWGSKGDLGSSGVLRVAQDDPHFEVENFLILGRISLVNAHVRGRSLEQGATGYARIGIPTGRGLRAGF